MNFVFDRTAEERVIKYLTIVDGATQVFVAVIAAGAIGGELLTRILALRWHVGYCELYERKTERMLWARDVGLGASTQRNTAPNPAG